MDYIKTNKPALRKLTTFAHEMFEGKHSEKYVSDLPIGYGKTKGFLLPFAIQCAKRDRSKGIIIACERQDQVIPYAQEVNTDVGSDEVAFPLVGHHPASCPLAAQGKKYNHKKCKPYHAAYAQRADNYPILFLTHSMLALKGAEHFQTWANGERVMVIIDEKPSAWWRPGNLNEGSLFALQKYLDRLPQRTKTISSAMEEVRVALRTLHLGSEFRLSTHLTAKQIATLSFMMEEDPKNKELRETLESLSSDY